MPLSKQYIDQNTEPVSFSPEALGHELAEAVPVIVFAYLHGSARDGCVSSHSDLDLAVYLQPGTALSLELYRDITEICARHVGGVRCDVGVLNNAEPVYCFEALKGRLLFTRDRETWLRFYSVSCREYEHQLFDYERQRRYRLEAT